MNRAATTPRVLSAVLSAAVALAASLLSASIAEAQPTASVVVDPVRQERVVQKRRVTGQFQAVRRSRIASREEGLVNEVTVEEGDVVEENQILARLDDTTARLEVNHQRAILESRRAMVRVREAELEKARLNYEKVQHAFEQKGASQSELDDAQTTLDAARASLAEAEADADTALANLQLAEQRLEDLTIAAPFAGSVVAKLADVGEWISRGDSVVELVELARIDAMLDIPQSYLGALLDSDQPIEVRVEAFDSTFEAPIDAIISVGDELARTFPVRVRLNNPDHRLKPGMSVVALVPTGEQVEVLTVSKDAVLRNDAGAFVYFNAGGSAAVAPIEVLFAVGDRVAVRSPALRPGAEVVIEGNERLFPGQNIEIVGPDPQRAAQQEAQGAVPGA